ncbi:HAD family hydrolase [Streptomyces sp. NBC_00825]|uniref:HAD family hydrolase n=1 Tax=unclassified Streptomyces TaxID=2593676 RepID=UPI002ED65C28|nr:HAD family hydrolase [Streptomyces sp. NBC_00826]WTH89186.1 HAD family hydrolase [Streptomyces sp. NBC_00825]WTH97910.1 HAD family hydrolase [Streptomyces sp. NBC_00822]
MIETVVFDIGETLTRDDRYGASWADWLGVQPHTLSALVGAVVTQGRDNAEALRLLRPAIDISAEYAAREIAGQGEYLDEADLYDDVRPALAGLHHLGVRVVVAGNQTEKVGRLLRALDLPADLVVTSAEWGVAKPHPDFFARVLEVSGALPHETLYVGDHPINDIYPAKAAGLRAAHLRRGPWGYWWADDPHVRAAADWSVDSLTDLLGVVSY